ncbi:PREDICTED: DDT domain-containing protein DDR4 isoform X1 [Nelumbo nucifera]|uniref:DDT domain-containing protein DDR4 isoform X1 n=1 Tax=Nelumbo nucifera TaxID=4432 RepID=A0A1U7ZNV6_NELNU|nr:PREDICTED: DDT domain-containing protein DDR4 isoform X1 [Nelumbo nucifera]
MAEKHGRGRPVSRKILVEEGYVEKVTGKKPSVVSVSLSAEAQLARVRLRERWELASVLNFLHVFQPIIGSKLEISAEEIETALIMPNNALAELHISLLKGIPPVSKNLTDSDMWVTVLCKKLAIWWPWVADGEIPLTPAHGEEISRYKEIDPTNRLLILKALCEIRAFQVDMLSYINDAVKDGTKLSTFRKDKIGGDGNGTTYWYDGDSVIGHRLYKEVRRVEFKPSLNGKRQLTQPTITFQWETLATNLEEFRDLSDKLCSPKSMVEAAVGDIVRNEIIPVLEAPKKKKERALKRQQRQAMLLNGFLDSCGIGHSHLLRDRKPVSYTYDEYDQSIHEAIQPTIIKKTTQEQKLGRKYKKSKGRSGISSESLHQDAYLDYSVQRSGPMKSNDSDVKSAGTNVDDKYGGDYDSKTASGADVDSDGSSHGKQNNNITHRNRIRKHSERWNGLSAEEVVGLRRSKRKAGNTTDLNLETQSNLDPINRLGQLSFRNTALEPLIISDSEGENF